MQYYFSQKMAEDSISIDGPRERVTVYAKKEGQFLLIDKLYFATIVADKNDIGTVWLKEKSELYDDLKLVYDGDDLIWYGKLPKNHHVPCHECRINSQYKDFLND